MRKKNLYREFNYLSYLIKRTKRDSVKKFVSKPKKIKTKIKKYKQVLIHR